MKGQQILNDDGSITDEPEEVDGSRELAAVRVDNQMMVEQLTALGVDLAQTIPPVMVLKLQLDTFMQCIFAGVPAAVADGFNLEYEHALGTLLQGVLDQATRPKLHRL